MTNTLRKQIRETTLTIVSSSGKIPCGTSNQASERVVQQKLQAFEKRS